MFTAAAVLTPDTSHLDYRTLVRASKRLDLSECTTEQRIAVLSDAAVQQLLPLLSVLQAQRGVRGDVYVAEYDSTEIEVFDGESALYRFAPDVVVILNSLNPLRLRYHRDTDDRSHFADRTTDSIAAIWDAIRTHSDATIIQGNVVLPYERYFGNFDQLVPESFYTQALRLNLQLAERAARYTDVLINDVAGLATQVGLRNWFDERMWTLAKGLCALEHLPLVAQNIVDIAAAKTGSVVKCVIVDLDNTMWGGVIGDDGIEGIELGPFDHGEPFHRLQNYLLELKRRGIILAVCSKNDHDTAIDAFRRHPDMVLGEDDIAAFVANWGPKPDNIRQIQKTLNIGFDSMVFLDDNPFERQLVRESLPEVIVPELPEDAADYLRVLSELNLFEATSFSEEDRQRADRYRQNASRVEAQATFSNISEYLQSLGMRAAIRRFDDFNLPRIAQLLQRSNQFNLTTRRYSLPECKEMMLDAESCLPLYVTLEDKFGDNGLISVVILRQVDGGLDIDSWLMSCRVLGRGVESFVMNRIVELAREHGCPWIDATYIPTAKNRMVCEFFDQFGFARSEPAKDDRTRWRLDVGSYQPRTTHLVEIHAGDE